MTNIDFTKSEQYTLSIRLSADGFSFSIHHSPNGDDCFFTAYEVNPSYSMTANIKEMVATTQALNHSYRRINILVDTHRFTPIPFELYEDEQTEEFFHYNFPEPSHNETVLCNILGKSNIALLFGMDKHAHQLLSEQFPDARIFACVSPLIEHFSTRSKEENGKKLYVHFRKNLFEVFAFDNGKLLLTNSFRCKHTADKVYYLLYVWQQLGFSQEKDELWLSGNIEEKEELLRELNKFLRKVELLPAQESLPFDIQTLMTCE